MVFVLKPLIKNLIRLCSVQYVITAINCGVCPNTTTDTNITCVQYYVSAHTNDMCMIAVQTKICGHLLGERSEYVTVHTDINSKLIYTIDSKCMTVVINHASQFLKLTLQNSN